jgi:hypothetical protein
MIGDDRVKTTCLACGQHDDHPKHGVQVDPERWADFHLDCHALMSPPCPSCVERTRGADGATGAEMLDHILAAAQKEI